MLTSAQLATVKAAILADSTAAAFPNTPDGNYALAAYLNSVPVAPSQIWRADFTDSALLSACLMSEVVALNSTAGAQLAFQTLIKPAIIDATSSNVRAAFSTLFGAGTTTRANLLAAAQRSATRFEAMFLTAAAPANISSMYGRNILADECEAARNS